MTHNYQLLDCYLELPCGAIIKNRLAKSAMSDSLADGAGEPTEAQIRLYERWAEGGVGVSIIGEVQVDPMYPEKPGNLALDACTYPDIWQRLSQRATINQAHLWAQLGHAGALAHAPISAPKGPSALDLDGLTCAAFSLDDIHALPDKYALAACKAKRVGFSGVQIHAGHGFLLSQFLSPLFNRRTDGYGGSIEARCRIVLEIIHSVRKAVGISFPIGIRINSSDLLEGGLCETDALEVVRMLHETSIDLIDISGGTYFPNAKSSSDNSKKGPYFLNFATCAKKLTDIPLMITGGFKTCAQAIDALASGAVDMVGLGRAMVLEPRLANLWLSDAGGDPDFPKFTSPPENGITAWYTMRLHAIAENQESIFAMSTHSALAQYQKRDDIRCGKWQARFASV